MNAYVYPARIQAAEEGGWLISFRDFPEGISQAGPGQDPVDVAEGCLQACIEGRLEDGLDIPPPSQARRGEVPVAVPLESASKAALFAAVSTSGLTRLALAAAVGVDEREIRRMLDPRHSSKLPRIARVLKALGKELQLSVVDIPKTPAATSAPKSGAPRQAMQRRAKYRVGGRCKL
jgi:antitoxin HicB